MANFSSVTKISLKDHITLEQMSCIYYLLYFQKNTAGVRALVDLDCEVNVITLAYSAKLNLKVQKTNIGAQKIDDSTFNTFEIVLANFQVKDKLNRAWFFQKTFLVANTTLEVIFGMPFLTLSNADIQFVEKELI